MPDTHALTASAFTPARADAFADAVRRAAGHDDDDAGGGETPAAKDDAEFERSRERSDTWTAASRS